MKVWTVVLQLRVEKRGALLFMGMVVLACTSDDVSDAAAGGAPNRDDGGATTASPDASDATVRAVGPGTVNAEPLDEAAYIYDQEKLLTFEVEIAQAALDAVDANPALEIYAPATLRFEGASYDVGYRYKGSVGAFLSPCTTGYPGLPKAGKCSVKLSFNWADPEGRFFGLKKLQFHSMNEDPSMLRERLAYGMFREMGVPAPRVVHAILVVNGQPDLYALVEQIDGRFTRSRFTEGGEGNLYKEIWPLFTDPQTYLNALKTNENENPSVDRMLELEAAVRSGSEAFETWIDLDAMARYIAVDRVIMNDDGIFHFYCFAQAIGNNPTPPANHNYYWYEAREFERFWLIPWDLDHSMQEEAGLAHIDTDWTLSPAVSDCGCGDSGFPINYGPAPGCDPVIQIFQGWKAEYDAKIEELVAGPFAKENVDTKLATWRTQIEGAGYTVSQDALDELIAILDRARSNRGFVY